MGYPGRGRRAPRPRPTWRWAARFRRTLFLVLVLAQILTATRFMISILPYHATTGVEQALCIAFALSFGWVSVGAWLAVFGFFVRLFGDRQALAARAPKEERAQTPLTRTALIMPICHEPVAQCFEGLAAVYRALERSGDLEYFDFYVLSDSSDPDIWLEEQAAWQAWVKALNAAGKLFYRRRRVHLRRKSGNVADFLRRWGRNYKYFMVLDADSLMGAETLADLVRLMECHPRVGILQAPPSIVRARSLFARVQQFANRLYGTLFSTGLSALQLGDGAYWGHNAIIRTQPFMRLCGLPALRGVGLFRGPILSHDFAEAAFMRRGGYEVWLEPTLRGSYEESPPSLVDELSRDRRWARGNLQHMALMLGGWRLRIVQRFMFLNGVLAYAAAPLWLAFLVLAGLEVAQFTLWPINYFPEGHRLFPVWPEWHPERATLLFASSAFVLFIPKILAWLDTLIHPAVLKQFNGPLRLTAGVLIESLVSVLLAPVRMLAHSRFVLEAFLNLHLSWSGQNRGGSIDWWPALRMHLDGVLLGLGWSVFAWWLKPEYFFWSLPVTLPLILAPLVAVVTSRVAGGDWFSCRGLLVTPEDRQPPGVTKPLVRSPFAPAKSSGGLLHTLRDPQWLAIACYFARRTNHCSEEMLKEAEQAGVDSLDAGQRQLLADDGGALVRLSTCNIDSLPGSEPNR